MKLNVVGKKEKSNMTQKTGIRLTQSEKDVSYFKDDLHKIRAKPQMYAGATDVTGVFTLLREILDNAVDEARAGRNNQIDIWLTEKAFWVRDLGTGIPVKKHPEAKISTLTHILTSLQSSAKMTSGKAYKTAIGTHGAGLKVTNALSKLYRVWTYRPDADGWHHTEFQSGVEKVKVQKSNAPKLPDGTKPKSGTVMMFIPDEVIFGKFTKAWLGSDTQKIKTHCKIIEQWSEMAAYMNAGLQVTFTFRDQKPKVWKFKDGIYAYTTKRLSDLNAEPINKKPIFHTSQNMDLVLSFADVEGCEIEFFTNTIRNIEQGVHADALYKAMFDSLKPFQKKLKYTPTDLRDGCVGLLNYKIDAPQFDSQTKEKLVDGRVKESCYKECLDTLEEYWKKNKSIAQQIVKRASELRSMTADFLKDKKLIKNVNAAKKKMSAKLADIVGNTPVEKTELYLVEGDSAGGQAKAARNKSFQAVFPLKGKPLNVMTAKKDKINNNKEIAGILAAIGLDMNAKTPTDKVRYGKIIFLADGDDDGHHINALLIGLFWKYLPGLFKQGRIYLVDSPKYITRYKGKVHFAHTKEKLYKRLGTQNLTITYLKGWGELNAIDMKPLVFDTESRKLIRLTVPNDKKSIKDFEAMLSKDKELLREDLGLS
jgi:DNA gyrase subunit B